jgi:Family of unknown function (DUF5906)
MTEGAPEEFPGIGEVPPKPRLRPSSPLPLSDFVAYSPDHTYIYRPTGETWTSTAVNSRLESPVDSRPQPIKIAGRKKPFPASAWLDRNDAVEQRTWAPGEPQIIENRLVAEGGFFPKPGARVFNAYKPPNIINATSREICFWRDHLHALWPGEADTAERWLAHRVQRPGEKINHALVLGGKQGIGKDALLAPLKIAVGPWNFAEISPQAALGAFNEFVQSVVLRISEGKDLGDVDRFAFYEATKTLIAAPPDTLRVNPKYVKPYYALNVTGVIITTNHKVGGLFFPADDRRHYVAWSAFEPGDFDHIGFFRKLHEGGALAVARHLAEVDLSRFDPKAPPPHTQAFWEMANAMRSEDESEMADVIESLGRPWALIIPDIIARAHSLGQRYDTFVSFLEDRKNARIVSLRLEQCGYRRFANPDEKTGRWRVNGQRIAVYIRAEMTDREGFEAVKAISE